VQIISDFQKAKAALRRTTFDFGDVPSEVKQRIKETFLEELTPEEAVSRIIAAVRDNGDAALVEYTRLIDGIALKSLEVSDEERRNADGKVDKELITALNTAAEQVRSFHQAQLRHSH
jgi:histidinol dehydrogenase